MTDIGVIISPPIESNATVNSTPVDAIANGTPQPGSTGPGGTTGQVWKKASNDDYDASWQDEAGGGGGGGISDAPNNANYYIRHQLAWSVAAAVAQTGAYSSLSGLPTLGTAAAQNTGFFAAAVHTHAATDIVSGVLADGRIQASNVTQHQTALALATSQITSGTFADARVVASNITQHQASLSINYSQLTGTPPPLLISKVNVVASQVAQLALTAEEGDFAIRTDQNKTYARNTGTAGTMADWSELLSPTAAVSSVFGRTGAVNATSGDYTFAQIGSTPTTAAGYGIPAATASVDGYATSVQITKLNGIATGATANSSDATLLARANHTGTQTASTISDFNTAADARVVIGTSKITLTSKSANATTVLADGGGGFFHPAADTTARTWTIDSNANVAQPIGTTHTFVNENGAGVITIAITSDTMRLAGAGTTGNRTLAANGIATALKITSTSWLISGTGLT